MGNRARLRELFTGTAPIMLTANGLMQRGGDSTYAFSQDASFWYLTGINEPDIVLVMDRDSEYLIIPERTANREAFDGKIDDKELSRISGVQKVYSGNDGWEQIAKRIKKVKHVATLAVLPPYIDHYGLYTNPARATLANHLKELKPEIDLLDLSLHLIRMRMIKQPPEINAIQDAIDITIKTIIEVTKPSKLQKYTHEYEIEAAISQGFRSKGADGHSFEPIVAGGPRAVTLHNLANNAPLSADELIVIDIGAEVDHYAADITRTIALTSASKRQRQIHEAVEEIQAHAISLLKPGVFLKDYEKAIEQIMGEKLRELGLLKTITTEDVRKYYPHATSHFLGLNVHDIGDYDRAIEPGIVMTVEPGIYIPEEGIGVRIEDDILITPSGNKNLSYALPRILN